MKKAGKKIKRCSPFSGVNYLRKAKKVKEQKEVREAQAQYAKVKGYAALISQNERSLP